MSVWRGVWMVRTLRVHRGNLETYLLPQRQQSNKKYIKHQLPGGGANRPGVAANKSQTIGRHCGDVGSGDDVGSVHTGGD